VVTHLFLPTALSQGRPGPQNDGSFTLTYFDGLYLGLPIEILRAGVTAAWSRGKGQLPAVFVE
jgi:hypothetical protein